MSTRIEVISDTHGLLRPEVASALARADHIVHAGDVGRSEVLEQLRRIAPLTVVRGNVDHGVWAEELPLTADVQVGGLLLHVVHDLGDLEVDTQSGGVGAVIYGHSHKPEIVWRDGVLFLNPGSIGPRRFRLPIAWATLHVGGDLQIREHRL